MYVCLVKWLDGDIACDKIKLIMGRKSWNKRTVFLTNPLVQFAARQF